MKKIVLICLLSISALCFSACGSISSSANEEGNITKSDNKKPLNSKITVADYEITLETALFDNVNYEAYCELTVSKNDGNDKVFFEDRHSEGLNNNYFGENNRFSFLQDIETGAVSGDMSFEEEENVLHITYTLSVSADAYDGRLYLFDAESNSEESVDNCTDFFELTDIVDSKEFIDQNDDTKIYVSEMSVRVSSKTELDEDTISLSFIDSDGRENKILTKGKMSDEIKGYSFSHSDSTGLHNYKFIFNEQEDISKIESVSLNGVDYE